MLVSNQGDHVPPLKSDQWVLIVIQNTEYWLESAYFIGFVLLVFLLKSSVHENVTGKYFNICSLCRVSSLCTCTENLTSIISLVQIHAFLIIAYLHTLLHRS